jgi:hypothetical protein
MKRTLFLCTFTTVILFCTSLNAADWSFSAEPLFGVRYGTVNEYVYTKNSSGDYQKLSELNWEMKPVFYYGGKVALEWKNLQLSGYGKGFIPMRCGNMHDSDWYAKSSPYPVDIKTDYSISDNYLTGTYSAGCLLGYKFSITNYLSIKPFIAYDYQDIYFSGKDGEGWYGDAQNIPWNDKNAVHIDFTGYTLITYHSYEYITWTGFSIFSYPSDRFSLDASFYISPYIYVQALDYHCYRDIYFLDCISGWFSVYKIETSAAFNFTKNLSLLLSASWTFSTTIYGSDYTSASLSGAWYESEALGGTSLNYGEASLGIRYRYGF